MVTRHRRATGGGGFVLKLRPARGNYQKKRSDFPVPGAMRQAPGEALTRRACISRMARRPSCLCFSLLRTGANDARNDRAPQKSALNLNLHPRAQVAGKTPRISSSEKDLGEVK